LLLNIESTEARPVDPSSDRWLAYYKEARVRRRARKPELRTSAMRRRWRIRERIMVLGGILAVGLLMTLFSFVLSR
jgi:hypothetical protein